MVQAKTIPVQEGFFDTVELDKGLSFLNGSKCDGCGQHFFPTVERCRICSSRNILPKKIGKKAKLYSYTICHYPPPGGTYVGTIPYVLGIVLLDEKIIITARIVETEMSKLKVGMDLELCLEELGKDGEGNSIVHYAYRSVSQ